MKTTHLLTCCSLLTAAAVICGCASDKAGQNAKSETTQETPNANVGYKGRQYAANPPKIKFGEFKSVELKETELPAKENTEDNRKSVKIIDQRLLAGLKSIWPNLKVIPVGGDFSTSSERVLQIGPRIEHISIVNRIFVGPMAGDSELVMRVDFTESSTGEIIANPSFRKSNNAWAGGFGNKDNEVRDRVVTQIVGYIADNK